jgi:hypothetical protein
MALRNKSLFLYGLTVDSTNSSLDFKVNGGPTLLATLRWGYYTLNSLMAEVVRAMAAQSPAPTFSYTIDRSIGGGLQNRVAISTASGTISLMFGTGPRKSSSISALIGYPASDVTGATLWSSTSAGISLLTSREGYSYLSPDFTHRVRGAVNISASGVKESLVYEIQKFAQVEYKHEPEAKVMTQWKPLMDWLIQQRPVELTPDYTVYDEVIEGTLERTAADGSGLGYQLTEMLPDFPFYYRTGQLVFRQSTGPFAVLNPQG